MVRLMNAKHDCYYEVIAADDREMGLRLGTMFRGRLQAMEREIAPLIEKSRDTLAAIRGAVAAAFPGYAGEIDGYAEGAQISALSMLALCMENEFSGVEHCTTMITNGGRMIAHNEDWNVGSENRLCILRRTTGRDTTLELLYIGTLGGNAVSVSSRGWVQAVNSLPLGRSRLKAGIPRNIVNRWMADTVDPVADVARMRRMQRISGDSHILVSMNEAQAFVIESTPEHLACRTIAFDKPFAHTNHFLDPALAGVETPSASSRKRHETACRLLGPVMNESELKDIMDTANTDPRGVNEIFSAETIGRILLDLDRGTASIWMRREAEKGWIEYPLPSVTVRS